MFFPIKLFVLMYQAGKTPKSNEKNEVIETKYIVSKE
jgi:hypothetical protein